MPEFSFLPELSLQECRTLMLIGPEPVNGNLPMFYMLKFLISPFQPCKAVSFCLRSCLSVFLCRFQLLNRVTLVSFIKQTWQNCIILASRVCKCEDSCNFQQGSVGLVLEGCVSVTGFSWKPVAVQAKGCELVADPQFNIPSFKAFEMSLT